MPTSPNDSTTDYTPQEQGEPVSATPPVEDWDGYVSALLPVLAETISIRLGQECELEYAITRSVAPEHPGNGLLISLTVGGQINGSVHLPLNFSLAHNLANAAFGQPDGSETDEHSPLDEARAQVVEDLIGVLAQTTVEELGQSHSVQLELAVSDRDVLSGDNSSYPAFLSAPAWQVEIDVFLDHTLVGRAILLIPHALFQEDDLDLDQGEWDEEEDEEKGGYSLKPEEMAALVQQSENNAEKEAEQGGPDSGEQEEKNNAGEEDIPTVEEEEQETPDEKEEIKQESEESSPAVDVHALHTTLLQASYQVEEELGALLGEQFELYEYVSRVITKKDFLHQFQNKIVVTNLAVSGDHYGTYFSVISLADAITLGGKLIMLPPEEISRKIKSGQLKEDEEDAFGEVINILTGAYSHAFGEYFPHKLRLKKDRMTSVAPTKVDISSDEPFPDGEYFLATYRMRLGNQNLEQLNILIPPNLVSLSFQDVEALKKQPSNGTAAQSQTGGTIFIPGQDGGGKPAIAIISDDNQQAHIVATSLEDEGVELIQLKLRDKMRERLKSYHVLGVFLILKSIDDNSLATMIKVRSVLKGRCPLIIGGPKWTRQKVIQAVRYGAQDILATPPDPAQIVDKAHKHLFETTAV